MGPSVWVPAAVVACTCAAWAAGARASGWPGGAPRDPMTVRYGAIALACFVVLCVVAAAMRRMGHSRKRCGGADGTAAIEMVLLMPIVLLVSLVMIQSMLLAAGNVVVHYAGYSAARAAIVVIPEKLSFEEPRNVMDIPGASEKRLRIRLAAVEAVKGVGAGRKGPWGSAGSAGDAQVILDAYDRFFSLSGRSTPRWVHTMLAAKWEYALAHTRVAISDPANGDIYGDHEDIQVSVYHDLYLSVPVARRLFGSELGGSEGHYAASTTATYTLTNQGMEDEIDVEVFPRYVGRGSS
ncbi:MAG TPA: TadE family protein [Phycisphaerae bacterium]|nr:TadE family protein [Phycisphaerae bacterium]